MATLISGSTGVDKIQDGTIVNADIASGAAIAGTKLVMPAGSVLQVVSDTSEVAQTTTSAAWADTALSVTLTPSSTSSKVYIAWSFRGINMVANRGFSFRILRNSTSLHTPSDGLDTYFYNTNSFITSSDIALDSPATTSAIVYKIQVRAYSTGPVYLNAGGNFKDTLVAMEISG